MKLKTLKDMERFAESKVSNGTIDYDELRAEAVKWVKELKTKGFVEEEYCLTHKIPHKFLNYDGICTRETKCKMLDNHDYEASDTSGAIKIIKYFFNLTEEDLV